MSHEKEKNRSNSSEDNTPLFLDALFKQLEKNPPKALENNELDDDSDEPWQEVTTTPDDIIRAVEEQQQTAKRWEQTVSERMEERFQSFFFEYLQEKHDEFKNEYFPDMLNNSEPYLPREKLTIPTCELAPKFTNSVLFQNTPQKESRFLILVYLRKKPHDGIFEILHIFEHTLLNGEDKGYVLPKNTGDYVCAVLLSNLNKTPLNTTATQPEKRAFLKEILLSTFFVRTYPFSIKEI